MLIYFTELSETAHFDAILYGFVIMSNPFKIASLVIMSFC